MIADSTGYWTGDTRADGGRWWRPFRHFDAAALRPVLPVATEAVTVDFPAPASLPESELAAAFVAMLDVCEESTGMPASAPGLVSPHISGRTEMRPTTVGGDLRVRSTGEVVRRRSGPECVSHTAARAVVVPGGLMLSGVRLGGSDAVGGGGRRGNVAGFSEASRRRLMDKLMSVDMGAVSAGRKSRVARALFVTLTYPRDWPAAWEVWKAQLKAFRKRVERSRHGFLGALWRLEFQRRGAPHFHLLLCFPRPVHVRGFRLWLSRAWNEVLDGGRDHLVVGCNARPVYGGGGKLLNYLAKYLGKCTPAPVDGSASGRMWGVWGSLPVRLLAAVRWHSRPEYEAFLHRLIEWGGASRYIRGLHPLRRGVRIYGDGVELLLLIGGSAVWVEDGAGAEGMYVPGAGICGQGV
jgi:hypothetical protein